ncbi:iron response transcriptional regulator IrrA [Rhodoblastus sp.]|uniref:iron response transcriptional regulator IrrA n=1 Tax=Rhodoblastus sp. TaxID=1962975 RepID=UPI003F95C073
MTGVIGQRLELPAGRRVAPRQAFDWKDGALARLVREKLRSADLRPTRQRISLASLLFVAGDRHVTVDQLFDEAKALRMPLSRATVYNTLHQFVAAGLVREIALYGSKVWYDTKTGSHCHFYDETQADLFDMPEDVAKQLAIVPPQGKRIVGVDVIVRLADEDEAI